MFRPAGRGAYGSVYKARDKATGQLVAIKVISTTDSDADDLERIHKEVSCPAAVHALGSSACAQGGCTRSAVLHARGSLSAKACPGEVARALSSGGCAKKRRMRLAVVFVQGSEIRKPPQCMHGGQWSGPVEVVVLFIDCLVLSCGKWRHSTGPAQHTSNIKAHSNAASSSR